MKMKTSEEIIKKIKKEKRRLRPNERLILVLKGIIRGEIRPKKLKHVLYVDKIDLILEVLGRPVRKEK